MSEAKNDLERHEVQALFESVFADIDENAVPLTQFDHIYLPLILTYRDASTRRLAGAALTCRSQVAVMANMMGGRLPIGDFRSVIDKHNELDLICVAPEFRNAGIGSALVREMQRRLISRGVKVWFGNVSSDLERDALRRFYSRLGFTVLSDGQPLPPLLGRTWTMPNVYPPPAFYFYKKLPKVTS